MDIFILKPIIEIRQKFGAAFHNGLRIKPIKHVRVIKLKTSSCAKIQNIFVTCKCFLKKARRHGPRIENKQASRQMKAGLFVGAKITINLHICK